MGCKAFTPHLVGLAKELQDQPFHLIASYNQRGTPAQAKHEIFQNGLDPMTSNVTVSMHASQSGVRGTGYVPYYMVFDHHGDLAHHHQGGPYHGGDGTAVLERVRGMLEQVPFIYTGKEPFERHGELAGQFHKGSKLNKALKDLAAALEESPKDPELARILAGVRRHKRRALLGAERLLGSDFKAGLKGLQSAAKEFEGTPWAKEFEPLLKALMPADARKRYSAGAKTVAKAIADLQELKLIRGNGGKVLNPLDAEFRELNSKRLSTIIKDLGAVRDQGPNLPAGKLSVQLLALLE